MYLRRRRLRSRPRYFRAAAQLTRGPGRRYSEPRPIQRRKAEGAAAIAFRAERQLIRASWRATEDSRPLRRNLTARLPRCGFGRVCEGICEAELGVLMGEGVRLKVRSFMSDWKNGRLCE